MGCRYRWWLQGCTGPCMHLSLAKGGRGWQVLGWGGEARALVPPSPCGWGRLPRGLRGWDSPRLALPKPLAAPWPCSSEAHARPVLSQGGRPCPQHLRPGCPVGGEARRPFPVTPLAGHFQPGLSGRRSHRQGQPQDGSREPGCVCSQPVSQWEAARLVCA